MNNFKDLPAEFNSYNNFLAKHWELMEKNLKGYIKEGLTFFQAIIRVSDELSQKGSLSLEEREKFAEIAMLGYFLLSEYDKVLTFNFTKETMRTLYFKYKAARLLGERPLSHAILSELLNLQAKTKQEDPAKYKIFSVVISLEIAIMNLDKENIIKYSNRFKQILFDSVLIDRYPLITLQVASDLAYREFRTGSKDFSGWLEIYKELTEALNMDSKRLDSYTMVGGVYRYKGYLDEASEYYGKAIQIAEKIGNREFVAALISNLADLEETKGNFEKALFLCYEILKDPQIRESKPSIYVNIAEILIKLERFEEAIEYLNKAMELDRNLLPIINILYGYCLTRVKDKKDFNEGIKLVKKGGHLCELSNNMRWLTIYHYFMGKIYLESFDLSSAIDAFKRCYNLAITNEFRYVVLSQLYLAEAYIHRYKISQMSEDLTFAQHHLANIITIAQEQELPILAEIYYLQGQLLLITKEYIDAEYVFTQAKELAEEYSYDYLIEKTNEQLKKLKRNKGSKPGVIINEMTDMINTLSKKLYIKKKETLPEIYFIIIFTNSGEFIYSYFFDESMEQNEVLISGLISAIQTMSSEVFGKGLRGIDFEGKVMIVETVDKFCGVLACEKDSFNARARLVNFLGRFNEKFAKEVEDLKKAISKEHVKKESDKLVQALFIRTMAAKKAE